MYCGLIDNDILDCLDKAVNHVCSLLLTIQKIVVHSITIGNVSGIRKRSYYLL